VRPYPFPCQAGTQVQWDVAADVAVVVVVAAAGVSCKECCSSSTSGVGCHIRYALGTGEAFLKNKKSFNCQVIFLLHYLHDI
jgi:hypothetical protein